MPPLKVSSDVSTVYVELWVMPLMSVRLLSWSSQWRNYYFVSIHSLEGETEQISSVLQ